MIPLQIKKIIALVFSAVIIGSCLSVVSYAEDLSPIIVDEEKMQYENVRSLCNSLTISSTTAYCDSICTGFNNVVQISVVQTLQKFWGLWIWDDVNGASWQDTSMTNEIDMSTSKSGLSSGTYRLKSVFTLRTQNGQTETITIYSSEETI